MKGKLSDLFLLFPTLVKFLLHLGFKQVPIQVRGPQHRRHLLVIQAHGKQAQHNLNTDTD